MNRRDLLKSAVTVTGGKILCGTMLPAFGNEAGQAQVVSPSAPLFVEAAPARGVPKTALTLRNSDVTVTFDGRDGMPYQYQFGSQRFWGEDGGLAANAIVCKLAPREYRPVPARMISVKHATESISFHYRVEFAGYAAATFAVQYQLSASSLVVTMQDVHEEKGFELIELALPKLMTLREEDGSAWMAEGRKGGSFVWLTEAKTYRFQDDDYFGRISTELPVGMVGGKSIGCVMEVTAFQDGTETEITGIAGKHRATLGCVMTYRVHGGRCYNMNDGGPRICGNAATPNLLAGQVPLTRFDFFHCEDEAQPWLTGAKIVRGRMPPAPTQYLSDRFLYIIAGKRQIDAEPKTTFAQSKALVHDIARLTDYAPQVAFISGFVYDGQDTGFPSEDKINSSLGTDADLLELIQSGSAINANVTLNVNWDDSYKSSPIFDEAFIARKPDGEIWKSRAWDGEDSYVTGMAKFMEGSWGARRVAFTVDHFRIHDAILIDAMSWFAVRNDWDPKHPASAYKNLIDGKYKVIEEFRKRGIAVTSEQLRYPFIGKLAESMDGPGVSGCPFGGEAVPMLSTIYRGSAIWGGNPGGALAPQDELFWNTRSALWFQHDTDRTKMTDFYYLIALPYSKLHRLAVERYESDGPIRRIFTEAQSHVEMDTSSRKYSAVWQGAEIAKDDATFCPIDNRRIAFYATIPRELRYPMPEGWDPSKVTARALSVQGRQHYKVELDGNMLVVNAGAKQPVIVYEREDAIRHEV